MNGNKGGDGKSDELNKLIQSTADAISKLTQNPIVDDRRLQQIESDLALIRSEIERLERNSRIAKQACEMDGCANALSTLTLQ